MVGMDIASGVVETRIPEELEGLAVEYPKALWASTCATISVPAAREYGLASRTVIGMSQ